ncbi:Orn/Lys/Arg family decarboxylase [Acidocella facilis]|uniref:Orn/Lys/Arg family decarboxylase n=1 Tax=Acidocella facilis TaxID=525 RepID=UPI001F1F06BE|nr:Orn/Lys/Arg decarboxylase N-terminal domain-containing protein [Acidocella facilis]
MARTEQTGKRIGRNVLLVCDRLHEASSPGRAARALQEDLTAHELSPVIALSTAAAHEAIEADPHLQALLLDWDLHQDPSHTQAREVLDALRARNAKLPVFLLATREAAPHVPAEVMREADGFIWLLEDSMEFVSTRILEAVRRYRLALLPPMFGALAKFADEAEYSWHTPGHTGGSAFLRSPAGRMFYDYFGEKLLRADLSISVAALGSLLDHTGPIGDAERYAAYVFGAQRSYFVTNGTSTANRVVFTASVARGETVLADRNAHKSIEHGLALTGARPAYLLPYRNHLGMIGPIPPASLTREAIAHNLASSRLTAGQDARPALAIVTNSTYDGLCYNAARVEELLGPSVDRILFDEAWFGHARFNPLYENHYAMRGDPAGRDPAGPTIFATQSTHKLLAALSQASMVHLREGRVPIEAVRFNESLMMHASTSPNYAIIASTDISSAMMDDAGGQLLTSEAIAEAVAFRQTVARLQAGFLEKGDWFFGVWQPDFIRDGTLRIPFADAPPQLLASSQACWALEPGADWHGFAGLEPGYCLLDPIKVTLTTPGMGRDGKLEAQGIPAPLLAHYLAEHGITPEKTAHFSILFLFSIGVTKGKWGSLVSALLDFKRDYDANTPLTRALPALCAAHPAAYGALGLKELGQAMFKAMGETGYPEKLQEAYNALPLPEMIPAEAHDRLIRGEGGMAGLAALAGGVAATAIVPYPPGIPLLMPGETFGTVDGPVLRYLAALERFDRQFPGFGHDTHGVEPAPGGYRALRY